MPSLYVHIPFCLSKCYYCDFVSAVHEDKLAERYTTALCRESALRRVELETLAPQSAGVPAETVFFGGGTPTTLTADQLGRILAALRRDFGIAPGAEVTIEANPRTHIFTDPGALEAIQAHGFNRLSLGAQSFDDELLRVIGRGHNSTDVDRAVRLARTAGVTNMSIDLIFALPGQTLAQWEHTIDRALALGVEHISLYNLTIEEGTVFGEQHRRGELEPAPSDLEADMYAAAIERMTDAGYEHYEVSNFARHGYRSRHNQVYWRREDYLGLGVGAHSSIENVRFANGRNTLLHVKVVEAGELPTETREELQNDGMLGEAMWLGLRLLEGVDLSEVGRRFGEDPAARYGEAIGRLVQRGLTELDGQRLRLTRPGLFLGNEVFCEFA